MWLSGILQNKGDNKLEINEFHNIFIEYFPSLVLYALKFVDDIEVAKDIVQEVLATFWVENEKLRNKTLVRPYLYKSVKNRALNFLKRESRKSGLDEITHLVEQDWKTIENTDGFSVVTFHDLKEELEKAINEMPEQRQRIFKMSRYQQMKHKEIAQELGISPKTVETQIYRSLVFLREKLKHFLDS